jgi:hypothetical protein
MAVFIPIIRVKNTFCRGHSFGAFASPFGSSFFPTDVRTKKMNPAIMNKRMGFDFHF